MSTTASPLPMRARRLPAAAALPLAIITAVIVGAGLSSVIAAIGHAAGVAQSFKPLQFATFTSLIVLGVLAGGIGWQVIRNRSRRPGQLLSRMVPVILLLSFIPDLILGISKGEGATWGGAAALMAMHVVVAAARVASYSFFLPAGAALTATAPALATIR